MKKKVEIGIIIIVALLLGVFVWRDSEMPANNLAEPLPLAAEEQGDTDTAGWQIYRNEKYGFELKYPANIKLTEEESEIKFPTERGEGFYIGATIKIHSNISEFKWTNVFRRDDHFSFDPVAGLGSWQKPADDDQALTSTPQGTTLAGTPYYRQRELDAGGFDVFFLLSLVEPNIVLEFRIFGEEDLSAPEAVLGQAREREDKYIEMIEEVVRSVHSIY